jgi:hypothetical protein
LKKYSDKERKYLDIDKDKFPKTKNGEFSLKGKFVITQNVMTVEDDREHIPVVAIRKHFKGISFFILHEDNILEPKSLHIEENLLKNSIIDDSNQLISIDY